MIQSLPTAPLAFTLDVAQLVMLGGLIWGLAKMSASVDQLRAVTEGLTAELKTLVQEHGQTKERISILEDRDEQRHNRRWDDPQ